MSDLITRLEALTGPCRECDALIELAVGDNGSAIQKLIDGSPHNTIDEIAKAADRESSSLWFRIPAYTASIDAAMTLLPEGWWLAGLCFNHVVFRSAHDSAWGAEFGGPVKWVTYDGYPEPEFPIANGQAATPAIALCIAALKAKDQP